LFRGQPDQVKEDKYWFNELEDKVAGYLFSVSEEVPAPQMYCCATKIEELNECLAERGLITDGDILKLPSGEGIVIKAANLHSNQNVFILVNDGTAVEEGEALDLMTNMTKAYVDIASELESKKLDGTKFIVEQFIGTSLPTEYKLHVMNGKVQAIDVIQGRGMDCPCYAVVDTEWNRLDYNGCFEPGGGMEQLDDNEMCNMIDFDSGRRKAGPVKKDMYLCDTVAKPDPCVIDDMIDMATYLAGKIGVYMRVDMFVTGSQVFVQEYSPNPMNGLRHCASKTDENGCVDSCFLGREWKASGGVAAYGGPVTAVPAALNDYLSKTPQEQCAIATSMKYTAYESSCSAVGA